jgi:hypothetical protein
MQGVSFFWMPPVVTRVEYHQGFCAVTNEVAGDPYGDADYIVFEFNGEIDEGWYDGPYWTLRPYGNNPDADIWIHVGNVMWTTVDL